MEVVIAVVFFVLGSYGGWRAREKMAEHTLNKYLAASEKMLNNVKENTLHLTVHAEHGAFYVYDTNNGSFITQVNSKEELFSYCNANYPNKNVIMSKEHLELFDHP